MRSADGYVIKDADVFLYDIKAIAPEVHRRCTGHTNERILENLRYIDSVGKAVEIRFPYVPGYNDGELPSAVDLIKTFSHVTWHTHSPIPQPCRFKVRRRWNAEYAPREDADRGRDEHCLRYCSFSRA